MQFISVLNIHHLKFNVMFIFQSFFFFQVSKWSRKSDFNRFDHPFLETNFNNIATEYISCTDWIMKRDEKPVNPMTIIFLLKYI